MIDTRILVVASGIFGIVVATGGTAEAAKGVKKANGVNGHHSYSGVVTSITPDKTGYGVFKIRTAHQHKKVGVNVAANGNGVNGQHQFNVTSTTRFEHHSGGAVSNVNALALQRGQHVRVMTTGQQTQIVHIITPMRSRMMFTRHRASVYHPHYGYRVHAAHHVHHHRR